MKTKPFHFSFPKQFVLLLVIPLLLPAFIVQKSAAQQARLSNLQFKQYDRYHVNGKLLFANSSRASVSFSAINTSKESYYLNFYAKTVDGRNTWVMQNYPVSASSPIAVACVAVAVDFKYLGVKPGVRVDKIEYAYTLTPAIVKRKTGAANDRLLREKRQFASFEELVTAGGVSIKAEFSTAPVSKAVWKNEMSVLYKEESSYALTQYNLPVTIDQTIGHDVPPVQEDVDGCLPGSFARSIGWLNEEYDLDIALTPQEIYDTLSTLMGSCPQDSSYDACRVQIKSDFLSSLTGGDGVTTVVIVDSTYPFPMPDSLPSEAKPDNVNEWIEDNLGLCDVELGFTFPGGAHIVTITHIECDDVTGCCTVWYSDDESQGDDDFGDECLKSFVLCNGEETFYIDGEECQIAVMVSECIDGPPPPPDLLRNKVLVTSDRSKLAPYRRSAQAPVSLLQNSPNPFDGGTNIGIRVKQGAKIGTAQLIIRNSYGYEVQRIRLNLQPGLNNIPFTPGRDARGLLYYTLQVDGQTIATRQMMTELQAPQPQPRP